MTSDYYLRKYAVLHIGKRAEGGLILKKFGFVCRIAVMCSTEI